MPPILRKQLEKKKTQVNNSYNNLFKVRIGIRKCAMLGMNSSHTFINEIKILYKRKPHISTVNHL